MHHLSDRDLLRLAQPWLAKLLEIPYFAKDEALQKLANVVTYRSAASIVFEWEDGLRFRVNERLVTERGAKGVMIAWAVLAALQHVPDERIRVEWLGMKPDAVIHTLRRAADRLERYSKTLATVVRAIGVDRGEIVVRANVPHISFSAPALAEIIRQSGVNIETG